MNDLEHGDSLAGDTVVLWSGGQARLDAYDVDGRLVFSTLLGDARWTRSVAEKAAAELGWRFIADEVGWAPVSGEEGVIPGRLTAVLDRVMRDVQDPTPVPVLASYDHRNRILWLWERADGGSGFSAAGDVGEESLVVEFADWLQEQFIAETTEAWGQARPVCPGHSHPAHPELIDGRAWWVCPADERPIAMIGKHPSSLPHNGGRAD